MIIYKKNPKNFHAIKKNNIFLGIIESPFSGQESVIIMVILLLYNRKILNFLFSNFSLNIYKAFFF